MPIAIKSGMTYKEFLHSTPKVIRLVIDAYIEKQENKFKELERLAWLNGVYFCRSIGATFGNEGYPKQPFSEQEAEKEAEGIDNGKLLMMKLQIAQANSEINKAISESEKQLKD